MEKRLAKIPSSNILHFNFHYLFLVSRQKIKINKYSSYDINQPKGNENFLLIRVHVPAFADQP